VGVITVVDRLDQAIAALAEAHAVCTELRAMMFGPAEQAVKPRATREEAPEVWQPSKPTGLDGVLSDVAEAFGFTLDALRGIDRSGPIVRARQEAMHEARQRGYSYPEIGAQLRRNHSTIMHGVRAVEQRREAENARALSAELAGSRRP
jgi:chromosomal replication initiation ATPase DnaA